VRHLAVRNRKEEWAQHLLRFVDQAGTNKAQIMRKQVDSTALEAEVLALRKDAAKAADFQSLIDWMVPNHDLVYHAIGATGDGFIERVRGYMAHDAVRSAIEAERGEG